MRENKILGHDPLKKRDSIWNNFVVPDEEEIVIEAEPENETFVAEAESRPVPREETFALETTSAQQGVLIEEEPVKDMIPPSPINDVEIEPRKTNGNAEVVRAIQESFDAATTRLPAEDTYVGDSAIVPYTDKEELEEQSAIFEDVLQYVGFKLSGELYGLDINCVRSIIRLQPITIIPTTPEFIEGVLNLRGQIIPVVSFKKKLGIPEKKESESTHANKNRVIIIETEKFGNVGFVVDEVTQVIRIPESAITEPPPSFNTQQSDAIVGVTKLDDHLVMLLDEEKILS